MNTEKPQNIGEYKSWLKEKQGIEISTRTETHYESITSRMILDFQQCLFWKELKKNLVDYDGEYQLKTGYHLLIPGSEPVLQKKPFDSFLLKTFRRNIVHNKRWPGEPEGGWILPSNWCCKINDIIRTLLVVKYLDGVEFMRDKIKSHCLKHNKDCETFLEARPEGYYAAHLYTKHNFEVAKPDWDTERVDVAIEIQVSTQLQEVIRKLLHKYYEDRRSRVTQEDTKWQWNYKSDEFVANYLGHILHYVEGMIMEIREKQRKELT